MQMADFPNTPRLDLGGKWRLDGFDERGRPLSCPAMVPGDVHSALLAANAIPDPFFGDNEKRVQWVAKGDWTFSRAFDVEAGFSEHSSLVLRIEDCDTFAAVFLNGAKVGETDNRFRRWDFDVRGIVREGRNEIRIAFASAWSRGDERAAAIGRQYPMSCSELAWFQNGSLVRKPACHRGWDWGLAQMTTGPCGDVALLASDGDRIDYVFCDQTFSDDLSHCSLRVHAILESGEDVVNTVEIDDPPLWWPAGQGPQRFHEYAVPVGGRTLRGRIGLRKLELDTTGGAMRFLVNNRPIFVKGANWIPCDAFDSRQTPARYRDLLESAAAANMNMIRLWGGGQFEKDCFYDICDELGLLVWHDQMFSCAVYPADRAFLDGVSAELEHQVRRLRDHACIALWCGDNECVGAASRWYADKITPEERPSYIAEAKARYAVQSEIVRRCDPSRAFWPSSPCPGVADFEQDAWHDDSRGDMHIWDIWSQTQDFSEYRRYKPRFCSEFGYQSFPSPEVAQTFCPPGKARSGEPDFEWHQKNIGGNNRIRTSLARLFPPARDPDAVLYLSQVQQALAIRTAVEAWRTLRPRCMGTLYWQLNDLWPVSSWSSIDYGGKWKHLHYHARRFFAPVAIVAKPSPDSPDELEIWALNDTPQTVAAEARVRLVGFDGSVAGAETIRAVLQPGSATLLRSRPLASFGGAAERGARFVALELRGRAEGMSWLHESDFFFASFRDAPIADASVTAEFDGLRVTLSTDKPAFFVWANARGVPGEFSDNSITLLPGEPRTLVFSPKGHGTDAETFRRAFSLSHLSSSFP